MAQYFIPPRHQTSRDQLSPSWHEAFKLKLLALDESAVYIFPNPPSALATSIPPSPSQASELSIPTELTLSATESDCSGSNRPLLSNSPHSPTPAWESHLGFPEPSYCGVEKPTSSNTEGSSCGASPVDQDFAAEAKIGASTDVNDWRARLTRYRKILLPEFLCEFTSSQQTVDNKEGLDEPSSTSPNRCHSVAHLPPPFLSFMLSLFSIDESTAELLMSDHDTSDSALFPGTCLHTFNEEKAALVHEVNAYDIGEEELHGLAKLLVEQKINSHYAVRHAFWEV